MLIAPALSSVLLDLARVQGGAVSRGQAIDHGLTDGQIEGLLVARRWQKHLPGVYLTFTGPVPPRTLVWGALLYAGHDAVASLGTAAWLWGLRSDLPPRIEVCVPIDRRVVDQPGLHVASRRHLRASCHPTAVPPRTRIEDTVLDLTDRAADADEVVTLITGVCQRRRTTAARLGQHASKRKRLRWRGLVRDVLDDVRDGIQSALEHRWRRDVERAHGLPTGERNRCEGSRGAHRYRDVRYRKFRVVVELDGNAAHPVEDRELDRVRDNDVAETDHVTLRYGWKSVAGAPCTAAAQVGRVLASRGWQGRLRPCGQGCGAVSHAS